MHAAAGDVGVPFVVHEVEVVKTIRGDLKPGDRIPVRQTGVVSAGSGQLLRTGEEHLLFLLVNTERREPAGQWYGQYVVVGDPSGAWALQGSTATRFPGAAPTLPATLNVGELTAFVDSATAPAPTADFVAAAREAAAARK